MCHIPTYLFMSGYQFICVSSMSPSCCEGNGRRICKHIDTYSFTYGNVVLYQPTHTDGVDMFSYLNVIARVAKTREFKKIYSHKNTF